MMTISSSFKQKLKPTSKIWNPTIKALMRKWWRPQNNSNQYLHQKSNQWWIKLECLNPCCPRGIHQIFRTLQLWSHLTGGTHHLTVYTLQKLGACGISNMRSAHQNPMNYSSRQNSNAALLFTLITYTTTSIYVTMRWLESEKTSFLLTSPSKYTLIFGMGVLK